MSEDRDDEKRVPLPASLDSAQVGEELADDVDFEPEDELGGIAAAKAKLKKMRDELALAKKERQEYLDGWQRCKADSINARRDALQATERTALSEREKLVEALLPALDSFDMAMKGDSWQAVDASWRSGMEGIHAQLLACLQNAGVTYFGAAGDTFDVMQHEALQEIEGDGKSGTVARVIRRGWRLGERILRPAQVVLFS